MSPASSDGLSFETTAGDQLVPALASPTSDEAGEDTILQPNAYQAGQEVRSQNKGLPQYPAARRAGQAVDLQIPNLNVPSLFS